jgi:hypothetical protein
LPAGCSNPPLSIPDIGDRCLYRSPKSELIESLDGQGEALKRHFNAVIAACELPVPRGKLKNLIKTFCGDPLMRGVDELCTKLDEECEEMMNSMRGWESTASKSSELSPARYKDQCRIFEERNTILVRDNKRPEDLQFYMMSSVLAGTSLRQQQESKRVC